MQPVRARARVGVHIVCACALVTLGAMIRFHGVAAMSLWADEAVIANAVSVGRLAGYLRYPATNRPFGYLVTNGWIANVHNSELSLRLLSLLPSIGTLVLLAFVTRWLFRSRALALVALASMAVNAWSVTYAKEFKPYALEQFVVVACVFLYLVWVRRGGIWWLASLAGVIAVSPLFSHTAVFVVPGLGLLVWLDLRDGRARRERAWFFAALVSAMLIAIVQYALIGSQTPADQFTGTSEGYLQDVPIVELPRRSSHQLSRLILDFASVGLDPPDPRTATGVALAVVFLGGWLLAIGSFVARRERAELLLLVAPVIVPAVLALVFTWPFGPERMNLYMVPLVTLTVFLGWDRLYAKRRSRWLVAAVVVAAIVLQIPADTSAFTRKHPRFGNAQEEMRPALERIVLIEADHATSRHADPACIVFSSMSVYALNYYRFFSTAHREGVRGLLSRHPSEVLGGRESANVTDGIEHALHACRRLWIVLSHYNDGEVSATRDALSRSGAMVVWEENLLGVVLVLVQQASVGAAK